TLIPTTGSPTIIVNGIPTAIGGQQTGSADVNGKFTMNLFCNSAGGGCSVISPSGTQWQITVTTTGIQPPAGTGPQACSATITVTGASQSVTSNFSCPALEPPTSPTLTGGSLQGTFTGGPTFTISTISELGFIVSVTTTAPCSVTPGQLVAISNAVYAGNYAAFTGCSGSTFTFVSGRDGLASSSGGTVT